MARHRHRRRCVVRTFVEIVGDISDFKYCGLGIVTEPQEEVDSVVELLRRNAVTFSSDVASRGGVSRGGSDNSIKLDNDITGVNSNQ